MRSSEGKACFIKTTCASRVCQVSLVLISLQRLQSVNSNFTMRELLIVLTATILATVVAEATIRSPKSTLIIEHAVETSFSPLVTTCVNYDEICDEACQSNPYIGKW